MIAVRALLYRDLPALLTNDSWDYLKAGQDIARDGDFFSPGLRDVRLPGYSTILALASPMIGWSSDSIVVVQSVLGLATAALGWLIGTVLGSRLVSWMMAAFLGFNPVYLLNEHAVMCEGFALTLYVLLVLAGTASLERRAGNWATWTAFGLLLGLSALTRANIVTLGAAIAGGACILQRRAPSIAKQSSLPARLVARLRPAIAAGAVALAVVTPWFWRNWAAYGQPSLFSSTNRNLVMYKNMHRPLDASLPTLAAVNHQLDYHQVDFEWLAKFTVRFPPRDAEELARRIWREEIAAHPTRHVRDVLETAAGFAGFDDVNRADRAMVTYWFRALVGHVPSMTRLGYQEGASLLHDWTFGPRDGDTAWTRLFARSGELYLRPVRAVGFLALAVVLALYVRRVAVRRDTSNTTTLGIVVVLTVGYLGTLATHAVMLMHYDRYSTMFDFLGVLIAAVALTELLAVAPSPAPTT